MLEDVKCDLLDFIANLNLNLIVSVFLFISHAL